MLLLPVLLLVVLEKSVNSYKILGIFPATDKSHFLLMKPLMEKLAVQGHQVDVVSQFPLDKPIPNYRDIIVHGSVLNRTLSANNSSYDLGQFLNIINNVIIKKSCAFLTSPEVQKLIHQPPTYDAVIIEVKINNNFLFVLALQKLIDYFFI